MIRSHEGRWNGLAAAALLTGLENRLSDESSANRVRDAACAVGRLGAIFLVMAPGSVLC